MSTSVLIAGWSPTPQVVVDAGLKQAPCTEVHVVLEQGGNKIVLRFRTRKGMEAFIRDLQSEANVVWPEAAP